MSWFKDAYGKGWQGYYENGIIPNIWKGITGQTSADRNTEKNIESAEKINQQQLQQANEQFAQQMAIAQQNFGLQKEQFDYQKQLNQLQMDREDNAMQRRVADLKSAGLSPLMATDGAQAGQLISAQAPQLNADSAYQNMANARSDIANRSFSARQFATQMSLQNAQLAVSVLDKLAQSAQKIPDMIKTSHETKWNDKYGWRNQSFGNALVNAVEKLYEKHSGKINLSSVGSQFGEFQSNSIKQLNEIQNNIKTSVEQVTDSLKDTTENFNQYGIVNSKSKYGHLLDNENYDNNRSTAKMLKEETMEKYYKSQLKNNNDDKIAEKLWKTDDYLKKHISLENWLETDWNFRKNYIKYGYFKD